jgi:V/A-type H+-transporting ATPase subunit K
MYSIITLMTTAVLALICTGFYLERHPRPGASVKRWFRPTLLGNILLFFGAQLLLLANGIADVAAEPAATAAEGLRAVSLGTGLAYIGIALPTAASTLAAALAVGPIGAASLAAVTEKPEIFGRTLVYLGLAEGIAIYGLVLSIVLLDKV